MRNWLKSIISVMAVVATVGVTNSTYGVAAFARQTGVACSSCHTSAGFPTLTPFGQAFKAGGYTQGNEDAMMGDGEALSIPKAMNLSVVFKARHETVISGGTTTNELQVLDEGAILAGGRVGKNIGFLIEGGGDFVNFKLPMVYDVGPVKLGIVPWMSDGLGPAFAMETISTGNADNIRINENKHAVSAQSAVDWGGAQTSSGVGLYVWHPMGFLLVTPWAEGVNGAGWIDGGDIGYYARAAATPELDFGQLAAGVAYKGGAFASTTYSYICADVQLILSDIPLMATITYANDLANTGSAVAVAVDYQVLEDQRFNVNAGFLYDLGGNGNSDLNVGIKWGIALNLRLDVNVGYNLDSGDVLIQPMLFGSF